MAELTADHARAGWLTARAIAGLTERIAALPESRALLRGVARAIGPRATTCSASIFGDWARDAAEAFGHAEAASVTLAPLGALVEGIRIIDDIQDEEPHCLPMDFAYGAFARVLELTCELPFADDPWRAAAAAIGRGIRETAIGQQLETTATGGFAKFWEIVDRKTPPLVATASSSARSPPEPHPIARPHWRHSRFRSDGCCRSAMTATTRSAPTRRTGAGRTSIC